MKTLTNTLSGTVDGGRSNHELHNKVMCHVYSDGFILSGENSTLACHYVEVFSARK